jgi:catechol 2,3-dioxygenase-like lactoylglutathione lyase family enzyme
MIQRLDHINLVVSDLEEAKTFFLRFGFSELDRAELAGDWISAVVGLMAVHARYVALVHPGSNTNLELIEYLSPPSERDAAISTANQIGYRHIAFAVDQIEMEVERLKHCGVRFLSEVHVFPKTGKKLVYLQGPDAILIELAEYPAPDRPDT